jgi:protoheme IX farnesyltransferase
VLLLGNLGIGMAASAAAAINHVLDAREDAKMARTRHRPLPQGDISERNALVFSIFLGVLSMVILVMFINTLTAVLTFLSLVGYAVVYTMYLKRATPQNIVIGGAAGAAPPVLGWVALTGTVDPHALLLFLIIFIWTPPHFWALAIHRRDEYAKVDIPMLPVTHGVPFTRLQILLYTVMLLVVSVLPFVFRMSGPFYLVGAVLLGAGFLYYAILLMKGDDESIAMKTFGYSIWYLMAMFTLLLVDHYLPLLA